MNDKGETEAMITKAVEAQIEAMVLQVACERCDRAGELEERGRVYYCIECGGAGFIPTKLGRKILTLMRNNFGPMLKNETEQ